MKVVRSGVNAFAEPALTYVRAGIERLFDYQGADYARRYLARLGEQAPYAVRSSAT